MTTELGILSMDYEILMDILSHLPTGKQEVIKDRANKHVSQYCDKYDNHLQDFKDAAYNYELSKLTRNAVYQSIIVRSTYIENFMVIYEGFKALDEIKDYFKRTFDWILNDYIRSRYNNDIEPLKEPLHEVII